MKGGVIGFIVTATLAALGIYLIEAPDLLSVLIGYYLILMAVSYGDLSGELWRRHKNKLSKS